MTGKYIVGAWMDEWFKNYAKIKVRPSSHHAYQGYIDNHIKPDIGEVPLEKLTSLELQKFYKKLLTSGRIDRVESKNQAKGLSPKTVRNICQIIASAMKLAKEQRLIAADPTEGCALPKLKRKEMKTLPIEQLADVLCGAGSKIEKRRIAWPEMGRHRFRTRKPLDETVDRPDQQKNRRCLPENQEGLPDAAPGRGHGPGSETAEEKSGQ